MAATAHELGLAGVARDAQERRGRDGVPHEPECLDDARPRLGLGDPEQRGLEADDHLLGGARGPLLERALREHAAEPAGRRPCR